MTGTARFLLATGILLASLATQGAVNSWTSASVAGDIANSSGLAIDPSDSSVVYVLDHPNDLRMDRLRKSTDGGVTWSTLITSRFGGSGIGVVVHPAGPSTLYIGGSGLVNGAGALYKSMDGGLHWTASNAGIASDLGPLNLRMAFDPVNPSVVYVRAQDGLYKSTDGAASWSRVLQKYVVDVAVDPSNGDRIYAADFYKVNISADGGSTWSSVQLFQPGYTSASRIAIDPAAPSRVVVGASFDPAATVYRSSDAGVSWIPSRAGPPAPILDFAAIRGAQTTFMASTPCGMYRTIDAGDTWVAVNGGLPSTAGACGPSAAALANSASDTSTLYSLVWSAPDGAHSQEGMYKLTSDTSGLTPTCYGSATPNLVAQGGSSQLSVYCSPAATSYAWSANTGFGSTTGGTVSPTQTTVYTVQGTNANGAGNVASITLFAPSPRLSGISTRGQVLPGDGALIAGFVVSGPVAKTVAIRARGPSLGLPGALADPVLSLVTGDPFNPTTNDDWQSGANAAALAASGFAPADPKESALLVTLSPGIYTAVVSGAGRTRGLAIVEVFEIDQPAVPLAGISTRGEVLDGDNVLIGGFAITGNAPQTVVVRARGPSLGQAGVANALANPTLQVVAADGSSVSNDDWATASNAADIRASGFAPSDAAESALMLTLPPGNYTAIVRGVNSAGIGIVEVFAR